MLLGDSLSQQQIASHCMLFILPLVVRGKAVSERSYTTRRERPDFGAPEIPSPVKQESHVPAVVALT